MGVELPRVQHKGDTEHWCGEMASDPTPFARLPDIPARLTPSLPVRGELFSPS